MTDAILSTRRLFEGWLDLLCVRLRLAGDEVERPIVDHPSGSAVLLYDPDRRVATLVRQTRVAMLYLGAPPVLEAVSGCAEGDDFAACARREVREEAGIDVKAIEKVGETIVDPSTSTERIHLFLAAYDEADRVGKGGGLADEDEEVRVLEMPLAELWRALNGGGLVDAKTLILAQALRLRRPDLFED